MPVVMAFGWRRFVLIGILVAALAASFMGRAEASSLLTPTTFARSATPAAVITPGDGTLALRWQTIDSATKYRVSWRGRVMKAGAPTARWSETRSGLKALSASKRSYTLRGLTNGYQYQVRLESKSPSLLWVVRSTVIGSPATVPAAPTDVTALAGDGQATISWRAPVTNGGSTVTGYAVTTIGGTSKANICRSVTLSCTVTGLTNGTSHTFTVKASNARGSSVASMPAAPVTPVLSCAHGGVCTVGSTGPGGGKVFYAPGGTFEETGAPCGSGCKYLEVAPVDWNGGVGSGDPLLAWGNGRERPQDCNGKSVTTQTTIGSGFQNTANILDACTAATGDNSAPAALAAACYLQQIKASTSRGAWFLPSRDELSQLAAADLGVTGVTVNYWTSSEANDAFNRPGLNAFIYVFGTDRNWGFTGKSTPFYVRPVRAF